MDVLRCIVMDVHGLTMFLNSAPPTPTMTMDSGSLDAATILSTVWAMSVISPSWERE